MSDEFYRDMGDREVERLARAIATKRGYNPDLLVLETGYPDSRMIPIWWKYQDDALNYVAMRDCQTATTCAPGRDDDER